MHHGRSIKHISGLHFVTYKGKNSVTCVHKYIFHLIISSKLITIISLIYFFNVSCIEYIILHVHFINNTHTHMLKALNRIKGIPHPY